MLPLTLEMIEASQGKWGFVLRIHMLSLNGFAS